MYNPTDNIRTSHPEGPKSQQEAPLDFFRQWPECSFLDPMIVGVQIDADRFLFRHLYTPSSLSPLMLVVPRPPPKVLGIWLLRGWFSSLPNWLPTVAALIDRFVLSPPTIVVWCP